MQLAVGLLAALFVAGSSQIVLVPAAPDGSSTEVDITWARGQATFGRPGYAFYLDKLVNVVYRIEADAVEQEFGPALQAMQQVITEGLPELPHSYTALLVPAKGETGWLEIRVGAQAPVRLDQAGQSVYIDGYPNPPHPVDSQRLERDFGPALEMQSATLKTMGSYLVLLEHPDGGNDYLLYRHAGREYHLSRPGGSRSLDGSEHRVERTDMERDFAAALAVEADILAAGLPELAHSTAVLLAHTDGPVGEMDFVPTAEGPFQKLRQAGEAVFIDGYPNTPHRLQDSHLQRDFGDTLANLAQTRKTLRSYLYIPDSPEGPPGQITYRLGDRTKTLDQAGTGLTLGDSIEHVPESARYAQDFGAALASQHDILAAGLPEMAHSRMALLSHEMGPLGELRFQPDHGGMPQTLSRVGTEVFIDGYPDTPHAADATRLRRDFGPTLAALAQALKSLRSYIVLLESPDGAASKVIYRTARDSKLLEHPGESLTLDGIDHEPDLGLSEKDFGAAQTSTRQILDEGLPELAHSYVALVSHPAGGLGEVEIVEGIASGVVLAQAGEAVIIDGYSSKTYLLDAAHYRRDFGAALDATPPAPESHYLYFDSGSTRLAKESRAALQRLLESVRHHPAADITIAGHTDTVGGAELNERLSRKRSEAIAEWIRASGAPYREIEMAAYGKSLLAIDTPDNTPELLNRRVEIVIR
jgi:hypothetical protein